jgi:selenocysteine-specific elongation factor
MGDVLLSAAAFQQARQDVLAALDAFHRQRPLEAGISRQELRTRLRLPPPVFTALLDELAAAARLVLKGELVHAAGRGVVLRDDEAEARRRIEQTFAQSGLTVPALKDVLSALPLDRARAQKLVTLLLREGVLVKVGDDLVFHRDALAALRRRLAEYKATSTRIGVPAFKDLAGITRKYAIPLLEYLDREHVTRREGDVRVIL